MRDLPSLPRESALGGLSRRQRIEDCHFSKGAAMRQEVSPGQTYGLGRLSRFTGALRQFLYGMTTYEMVRDLERQRAHLENRLAILAVGGLLGVPLPANYYGLRLLPHLLPHLERERRRLWRERDLTDLAGDLH